MVEKILPIKGHYEFGFSYDYAWFKNSLNSDVFTKVLKTITFLTLFSNIFLLIGQDIKESTTTEDILYSAVIVDSIPTFIGGFDSLTTWMERNLKFPENKLDDYRKETKVYASFIVEKDGAISDVKTYTIYENFNLEVERVLIKMPNWIPAFEDNQSVRCRLRIPISFKIEENKRKR